MTRYRGYEITKEAGKANWYNVALDGELVHRSATEYAAMKWIDDAARRAA